jgi:type IV pilus assembly protein PilM
MLRLTRSTIHPIGLDIGHESVKMLQLGRAGKTLSVVASAQTSISVAENASPEERQQAVIEAIRQTLRRGGFHGNKAVVALPREVLHVRNLRLPPMPATELQAIIQFEAKNVLPFDAEDAAIEFLPAGEVRQGSEVRQEVIVLGVKNHDLDQYVAMLQRTGIVLEALDIQPCALYRTIDRFIRRREDEHEVNVLVDVGAQRSQVVIGKGREVSFIKLIDIGGKHFQSAVSRKLGISPEEVQSLRRRLAETVNAETTGTAAPAVERDPVRQAANDATRALMEELGREIALCLRYYSVTFRGQRPTKVRIVGGEAYDPQLLVVLNRVLPIPAEVGRILQNVDTSRVSMEQRRGLMTEWAVALGLALKTVEGTFGARDGRPRTSTREEAAIAAQLVDINNVLRNASSSGTESVGHDAASRDHEPVAHTAAGSTPNKSSAVAVASVALQRTPPKPATELLTAMNASSPAPAPQPAAASVAVARPVVIEPTKPAAIAVETVKPEPPAAPKAKPVIPAIQAPSQAPDTDSSRWRVLAPNGIEPPKVEVQDVPEYSNPPVLAQPVGAAPEASHA